MNPFWVVVIVVNFILFAVEISLQFQGIKFNDFLFEAEWNAGGLLLVLQILYMTASVRTVREYERAGLFFLGRPVLLFDSGPALAPLFLTSLEKLPRAEIQQEHPGNPEKIFRNEDKEQVPDGMVPPIRITFAPETNQAVIARIKSDIANPEYEKDLRRFEMIIPPEDDPLNVRTTQEVSFITRYKIDNPIDFIQNIGSRENADEQIKDLGVGVLTQEFGKITLAFAIANQVYYNWLLTRAIRWMVEEKKWGVDFVLGQIKLFGLDHDTNSKLAELTRSKAERKATVTKAEGERDKRRLEGEGDRLGEQARIDGRTDGYKRQMAELGVPAMAVLGAETARVITENPGQKTVIVGTGGTHRSRKRDRGQSERRRRRNFPAPKGELSAS